MSKDHENLIARRNRLEEELNQKATKEYNELMRKANESYQNIRLNTAQYYEKKAAEELDKLEEELKSGNTLSAMNRKFTADLYLSMSKYL